MNLIQHQSRLRKKMPIAQCTLHTAQVHIAQVHAHRTGAHCTSVHCPGAHSTGAHCTGAPSTSAHCTGAYCTLHIVRPIPAPSRPSSFIQLSLHIQSQMLIIVFSKDLPSPCSLLQQVKGHSL